MLTERADAEALLVSILSNIPSLVRGPTYEASNPYLCFIITRTSASVLPSLMYNFTITDLC